MTANPGFDPTPIVAGELALPIGGVAAVLRLLGDGNTVPFVARYRKEATGSLDEVAIRAIAERAEALVELDKRRQAILESIASQGRLTPDLGAAIAACATRAALEDLYLPYRPKRRTRATMARERGLEPLAARILSQAPQGDPRSEAQAFVAPDRDVPDVDAA
ncbi:MAG TPA: Tex-like N-terminal domain-containing protein, partial [Myxococcota bacterium]|nr:Tex-like N-terminal domain-containing protein [Myxococcota bacterium]